MSSKLAEQSSKLPRPLLIALDVDGTLAPIVDDPDAARVPDDVRAVLQRLVRVPGVQVALVTGRSVASLEGVVQLEGAWRAVEHGARVVEPDESATDVALDPEAQERLRAFERWAEEEAVPEGARLEDKPASRAIHVRELHAKDPDRAERILDEAARRAEAVGLHPRKGKAVLEAEVDPGDKGDALATIVSEAETEGVVYVGDDVTDYPAIRRASDMGGVGVFVLSSERPEAPPGATGTVDGTGGVKAFLEALAERLEED